MSRRSHDARRGAKERSAGAAVWRRSALQSRRASVFRDGRAEPRHMSERIEDVARFYATLRRLEEGIGGTRRLSRCDGRGAGRSAVSVSSSRTGRGAPGPAQARASFASGFASGRRPCVRAPEPACGTVFATTAAVRRPAAATIAGRSSGCSSARHWRRASPVWALTHGDAVRRCPAKCVPAKPHWNGESATRSEKCRCFGWASTTGPVRKACAGASRETPLLCSVIMMGGPGSTRRLKGGLGGIARTRKSAARVCGTNGTSMTNTIRISCRRSRG